MSINMDKAVMDGLNQLRNDGQLADVTLIVEGKRFNAHRVVLAACSDYFRAMFTNGNMVETRSKEIRLYGITARAMEIIINFIYTSKLELNIDNIEELLAAGTHIQAEQVIQRCCTYLAEKLDIENCLAIVTLADIYGQIKLRELSFRYICASLRQFSTSSDFFHVDLDQLQFILRSNYPINISEIELLCILCIYAAHHKFQPDFMSNLCRYINWQYISKSDLTLLFTFEYAINEEKPQRIPLFYALIVEVEYRTFLRDNHSRFNVIPQCKSRPINMRGMEMCLLKVGGFGWQGLTNNIMCFWPSKMKWWKLTSIPHIDQCNYGTAVLNNELYIVGGSYDVCLKEYIHPFGFKYCPLRDVWKTIAPIQLDRCRFTLNAVGDKYLYAVGGIMDPEHNTNENILQISNVERYDVTTNTWTFMPTLHENRSQHAGVVVDNMLYISGGIFMATIMNTMWRFDTHLKEWEKMANMPVSCCDHVMVAVDKRIYSCGGWYENVGEMRMLVQHIYAYDIESNTWTTETSIPAPRFYNGVSVLNRKIYIQGGLESIDSVDRAVAETMVYDVDTKNWAKSRDSWDTPADVWESTCASIYVPNCRRDPDRKPLIELDGEPH